MLRRLRVYFTGFGVGLIIVYFLFANSEDRNLDIWTPEQRILEDIRNDSVFQRNEVLACYVTCLDVTEAEMTSLWTDAKTKSLKPGGDPYRYLIQWKSETKHLEAEVEWKKGEPRKLIYLQDKQHPVSCDCND